MELSQLIKKIGHSLVEIRVRALKSIICKLDHSLLTVSDLVQEKMLLVLLLEWFNFPEVPLKEEALDLMGTLSKHPTAAQMLRDIGAVEFLTQLHSNLEPKLQAIVDGILDQLFMLPELLVSCNPVHPNDPKVVVSTAHAVAHPEEHCSATGYFPTIRPKQTDISPQKIAVRDSVRCLKFSTFPWLALTTTDQHILTSNESSLRSNNLNLVRTTCELLRDVIMQDFPAEIFLQRPSIVKNLLSLLRLSPGEGDSGHLRLQALACLWQLCVALRSRLRFHRDPNFYYAKQDPVSQNSSLSYSQEARGGQRSLASSPGGECSPRPTVVGRTGQRARGDGQDRDAASSSGSSHRVGAAVQASRLTPQSPVDAAHLDLPDLGVEDVVELQLQQLTLAQFTVITMERAIPLLKTESERVFQRVLGLLCEAVPLLRDSVSESVWDDHSLVGMELKEKLLASMEGLGDILSYHTVCSPDASETSLIHHRMAYTGAAIFTIRLLQTILPPEMAVDHLPESTASAIFQMSLDTTLGTTFPSILESAVAYLEQVNCDGHALYRRATRAALWMESTCNFLKETQVQGEKNWLELLELAHQAIDGLPYHQHLPIVKECIQICTYLWKFEHASPLLQTESQKVLLKLLSHPLPPVKTETYACTLLVVKDCLGIQNGSEPTTAVCSGVHFLLHPRVLYEISAFGLQDPAEKVNGAAKDILLFLLKGRLMMTASTWDRFNEALYPVIPILQSYAGTEDALGNCVLLISEVSDVARGGLFPNTDKLRASLRLLFTKQATVRAEAVHHLVAHLTAAKGASTARPALDSLVLSSLSSLYCLRDTLDIALDTSDRSFLKVESVEKLFGILTSDTVDLSLRRSAAEQLVIVLQDKAMHLVLKSLGVTDKVVAFISQSVDGNQSMDCLLEPCVCILRKLVYADPSLRHSLADGSPLLLTLLRASLLVKDNGGNVSEAAALMCLLLFDEIARVEAWSDKKSSDATLAPFSLPVSVTRRYNLPFQAASHHAVSPYCSVLPPASDLLSLDLARHALQLAWNTAWHSGVDNLLEQRGGLCGDVTDFHSDLCLSKAQIVSLRAAHLPSGLQDCVQAIVMAAGHSSVTSALSRLRLYLLMDRLALTHSPFCRDTLCTLTWQPAIARFLLVRPACKEDERLLVDVVAFLNAHFKLAYAESETEDKDLRWILELILNQESNTLLDLLLSSDSPAGAQSQGEPDDRRTQVTQRLQRELTGFFNTLLQRLTRTTDRLCLALAGPLESQLAVRLLQSLRVSDAPRFYGLPSLERTLLGMVNLTAQPGWSSHCSSMEPATLCAKYLSGLLVVISSFYVEWGGNSTSFMGKGVTKSTVISLLHLSHEMLAQSKDKDFISQWSLWPDTLSDEASAAQLGLAWLIPLWVDRDPEVRFASLGLGSALSSVPSGCVALSASCQNISGGLWGTLLNILLDQQESTMVRREAAFILQNLLVMPMPANADEAADAPWQNPCVHDEASAVSLVGLPALQALLFHCQLFQHVAQAASACYQGRYTFDLQPPAPARTPSPIDATSLEEEDSLGPWRPGPPSAPGNPSRTSSSLSTSSTVLLPGASSLQTPTAASPPLNTTQDTPASRLMTQGQSNTDTSDSSISQESRLAEPSAETCVFVTPDLLTAHCGLLTNLLAVLPEFTLGALQHSQLLPSLASLVDVGLIERCLGELRAVNTLPEDREDIQSQVLTLLQFLSAFCALLRACVVLSPELVAPADFLKPLLANAAAVLTLDTKGLDAGTRHAVAVCWAGVLTLLATLVRRDSSAAYPSVAAALGRHWHAFSGTLAACVNEEWSDRPLHAAALQFLCVLFSEEAKRGSLEVATATPEPLSALSDTLQGPSADELCELLLQSFEKRSFQDPLKKLTAQGLMALLSCSPRAQNYAAKAGLVDSCVEQMKQIQSQLQLQSVRPAKTAHRRKEDSCLKELKLALEMLRNALYRNDECKAIATDARLAPVLHTLWPWLLLDDPIMEAALELLCVYTANCTAACSSLCGGGAGVAPGSRGPSGGSLMHCVMKLASGVAADNSAIQKLAFSLLANLAMSRDCRGLLQKCNFLQAFQSVPIPKAVSKAGCGGSGGLLGLWLRLLVNLSLGEDGQQSLLRLSGVLELLVDLALQRRAALLILHNLCFCPASKARVLANDKALRVLLFYLESKETEVRSLAASALWALLHNCQKAKTTLKCPSVRLRVDEAHAASKKDAEKLQEPMNPYLLKCLSNLSQLLSD
ncbi:rotatin [Aplochiton taeniatus]